MLIVLFNDSYRVACPEPLTKMTYDMTQFSYPAMQDLLVGKFSIKKEYNNFSYIMKNW